ncbi:hypothetical protein D3C85_1164670 [compost metagenome]
MNKDILKRLNLRDQLSEDPLKLFSLFEKTTLAYILIGLIHAFMKKAGLTETYLADSVTGGTIGYFIVAIKLMYHDEAFSELRTRTNIDPEKFKSVMLTIGYSEKKDGIYYPKKRMFSIFYSCKSEFITHNPMSGATILTGPHNKLQKLANLTIKNIYD